MYLYKRFVSFSPLRQMPQLTALLIVFLGLAHHVLWAGERPELGEPYVEPQRYVNSVDDAVLSADGRRLFTLNKGVLRKYSLKPFEMLSSQTLDFENRIVPGPASSRHMRIYLNNDETRLIVYFSSKLILIDTLSGKIIRRIEIDSAIVAKNDSHIITLHRESGGTTIGTIWGADDLRKIDEIALRSANVKTGEGGAGEQGVILLDSLEKFGERLVLLRVPGSHSLGKLTVYDARNYQPLKVVLHRTDHALISFDLESLYLSRAYARNPDEAVSLSHIAIDLRTGKARTLNKNQYESAREHTFLFEKRHYSVAEPYILSGYGFFTLIDIEAQQRFKLYQFDDGHAILLDPDKRQFRLTAGAREHLFMKTSDGKTVAIDNETYKKYVVQ